METTRIGIVVTREFAKKVDEAVLKYLVLKLNTLQTVFVFEFEPLPSYFKDEFLDMLDGSQEIDREQTRKDSVEFAIRYKQFLMALVEAYRISEAPPDYYIVLSYAKINDNYYSTQKENIGVLALSEWDRKLAPPTIYEYVLAMILRLSLGFIVPSFRQSTHLGTKGCLCDFTQYIGDVRYKVLNAFICPFCREALDQNGYSGLADQLIPVLRRDWLGRTDRPNTPANLVKKMGYNLYTTREITTPVWRKALNVIQEHSVELIFTIIGAVIIAVLLLQLGLK